MKKTHYLFPAIFDFADDGISISFPDLPGCFPYAHSIEEAVSFFRFAILCRISHPSGKILASHPSSSQVL